ncbi:MAG: phage terminase small subunit P27 family, partial [Pseudomonadota bacterium]
GNPGKRALPKNEPQPSTASGDVNPPRPLAGKALEAWFRLVPVLQSMRVLSVADLEKLAIGCEALGDYADLRARIKKTGRVYVTLTITGSKVYRPRPEVAMMTEARNKASAILSEFGLSPSARSKVQTIAEEKESDPFAQFLKGKRSNG